MLGPRFPVGSVVHHFTILEFLGTVRRKRRYRCRCECGNEKEVVEDDLRTGTTKSCGCFRKKRMSRLNRTHGQGGQNRTYLYRTWESIWERTENSRPSNPHASYHRRKIVVDPCWETFEAFRDYVDARLGTRPDGQSLDRIDNNRGYEPGNIRWATPTQQQRNTSRNTVLTVDGVSRCIAEWAEVSGLSSAVICQRRKRGWSDDLAVTAPLGTRYP